ncbi:phosphoribosylformylglycinamidine synthase II, partial [Euryarchaeota archaeon ex4484_178]
QAVQLGNPIIKEPLIHAVLEANDAGIIKGMKDLGGGGLGSVIGEMCHAGGVGAEVHLDKVLLKEKDMAPWEIWVSESQERMLLAIENKDLPKIEEICRKWDIEMSLIGQSVEGDYLDIYWHGKRIVHLPLDFVTAGVEYERPFKVRSIKKMQEIPLEPNYRNILLSLLKSYNIQIGKIDPYKGALYTVDEAVRNLVAVGARPHSFSDGLNFGNPEREEIMGEFHESCRGLGDAARFLGIPYVSGNVSFYNEAFGKNIPPTPIIMAVGIIEDIRKAITSDFKKEGNSIYIVGETKEDMGGSEYYRLIGAKSTVAPEVNLQYLKDRMEEILKAIDEGLVVSCHDISHGGLAVTLAEMSIGGNIGAEVNLAPIGFMRPDFKLFSESPSRWVCEVKKGKEKEFEEIVKAKRIGTVEGENLKVRDGNRWLFNIHLNILRDAWRSALRRYLG